MRSAKKLLIPLTLCLILSACGPSASDAQKLGFESVEEMKSLQEKGFKTKAEFNEADAKKQGFANFEEMKKRNSQGYKTVQEVQAAQKKASSLGFDSIEEMLDLTAKGFKNKKEFTIAEEKRLEEERLAEIRKQEQAEVASFAEKCSGKLQTDVWSFAFNKGRLSTAQLLIGTTISINNMDGFTLSESDMLSGKNQLVMAGIGSFQGKAIPACIEKVELKFTNRVRGERKTVCFMQAYQDDHEFQMLRGISVFDCKDMDEEIPKWVESRGIKKLTKYERLF